MAFSTRKGLNLALAVLLLAAAALLYPLTVPHAVHHAHHTASGHAHALCAWLCAAGQQAETPAWHFAAYHREGLTADVLSARPHISLLLDRPTLRGPPVL